MDDETALCESLAAIMSTDHDGLSEDGALDEAAIAATLLANQVKELRSRIMALKKSVSRGDKKQKKLVQDELTQLETALETKQTELRQLRTAPVATGDEREAEGRRKAEQIRERKEQRRKDKETAREAERQLALAEIAARPDLAGQESAAFARRLEERGFAVVEVAADGHCLFSAVGCLLDPPRGHWELRDIAADYLLEHRADFEAFVDGEAPSFEAYCEQIRGTGQWGGQVEVEALSRALNVSIVVLQATGPDLTFNAESASVLHLSYHRHAFSLGEHYNALIRRT